MTDANGEKNAWHHSVIELKDGTTLADVVEALAALRAEDATAGQTPTVTVRATADGRTVEMLNSSGTAGCVIDYPQRGSHEDWRIPEDAYTRGLNLLCELMNRTDDQEQWYAKDLRQIHGAAREHLAVMMAEEWISAKTAYPTRPDVTPPRGAEDVRRYLAGWELKPEDLFGKQR